MNRDDNRSAYDLDALHGAWRLLLAVACGWALALPAFGLLLVGGTSITGCFLVCETPRPWLGLPLVALGGGIVGVIVNVIAWAVSPTRAREVGWRDAARSGVVLIGLLTATQLVASGDGARDLVVAVVALIGPVVWWRSAGRALVGWDAAVGDLPVRVRSGLVRVAGLAGLATVVVSTLIGSCSFAGGRCVPEASFGPPWAHEGVRIAVAVAAGDVALVLLLTRRHTSPRAWAAAAALVAFVGLVVWGAVA